MLAGLGATFVSRGPEATEQRRFRAGVWLGALVAASAFMFVHWQLAAPFGTGVPGQATILGREGFGGCSAG